MNRIIPLLIVLSSAFLEGAEPKPILVVREMDPWRMVIGSDSANFAIYNDGSIIYQRFESTPDEPFARRAVDDSKAEVKRLLGFDIAKVEDGYELSSTTDQMTTTIWTPAKTIEIYGDWRKPLDHGVNNDPRWKAFAEQERKMWESLPPQIRRLLVSIEGERKKKGKSWLPSNVEVMFSPYEYAPEESIVWPATWSGLKSDTTKKRGKDSYSVYLPAKHLPALRKFLATRNEKGAVLIDGKKMSASYRFPFVGELVWMR